MKIKPKRFLKETLHGARQPCGINRMMVFFAPEPIMHPTIRRIAIVLAAACTLASVSACREKHEPVKPTVAVSAPA